MFCADVVLLFASPYVVRVLLLLISYVTAVQRYLLFKE